MPFFSFQVTLEKSRATPPFSTDGISAARMGTSLPSGPKSARGSAYTRTAPTSLVASEMWAFSTVGACHQSRLTVPPPPRLVAAAGATVAAGAAGAVVAAAGAVVAAGLGASVGLGAAGADVAGAAAGGAG